MIVTGEREVTQKTEGLGGEFTYCTLGAAVEMDKLLTGENLPAFDQLGALLFRMATNQARPIAAEPYEVAGVGYLGESSAQHVWLDAPEIAIKTADTNDLAAPENLDLLDPTNRVRVIVTKQALQEGWDCPFAYVLCSLSASHNAAALTQLVGRILRQPHA